MSIKRTGSLDQALNRLLIQKPMHVKAGVMAGSKYPDGTSVATAAYKNEYGWKNIPSRAFIRTTVQEQKKNWSVLAVKAAKAGYDVNKILGLVGTQMQGDLQYSITMWSDPPNAPSTVKAKGFNKPLIDSSLMRDSIKYEIVEGKL